MFSPLAGTLYFSPFAGPLPFCPARDVREVRLVLVAALSNAAPAKKSPPPPLLLPIRSFSFSTSSAFIASSKARS
jgi:hypothetical protein